MEVSALASGSSGNCFYISNKNQAILVDAGISTKQILERLSLISRSPETIKAIFLTHEHSDHIKGVDVLARHFNIPIFATRKTLSSAFICSSPSLLHPIKNTSSLKIAGLKVQAFPKFHKAADPVSYTISQSSKKLSIITDAGHPCKNIIKNIADSDFLCLESNHDTFLLEHGPYPYFLKQWILSDIGHLSNRQAALSVLEHASPKLSHIILSHLSQTNNTPEVALKTFSSLLRERSDLHAQLTVSERFSPTQLFRV